MCEDVNSFEEKASELQEFPVREWFPGAGLYLPVSRPRHLPSPGTKGSREAQLGEAPQVRPSCAVLP